ncbi:MAG: hypothetical protein QUS09_08605, partial [Methanotrichaceae archaeon]|nr:hypothetical protein [Methanotrichaceae archaeon]
MKDREDLYRDNFINDQVGFESMFPEPPALKGAMASATTTERGIWISSLELGRAIEGGGNTDLKEV